MEKTQQLNQKQRGAFENTLREAKNDARRALERAEQEAHAIALNTLVALYGVAEVAAEAMNTEAKLDELTKRLEEKGFELRGSQLRLTYDCPDAVREAYDKQIADLTVAEREKLASIENALRDSWQIATIAEAKELVAGFAA
jgi:hypothetical protein